MGFIDGQVVGIGVIPSQRVYRILHQTSFLKRHSLPSYDHYKPRYGGMGWLIAFRLDWIGFRLSTTALDGQDASTGSLLLVLRAYCNGSRYLSMS